MKFKSYSKIRQFKDVVRNINFKANYKGFDENNQPIYQESKKPTIEFIGTVKLHGTNAQISYDGIELLAGKRGELLGVDELNSHFGFNSFVHVTHKEYFKKLMQELYDNHCVNDEQVILYGEFAGGNIKKGVALSQLEKSFYMFDCKIWNKSTNEEYWIDINDISTDENNIYNIYEFETYSLNIDFNEPQEVQNQLVEITNNVEKECPVGKALGVSGIGEGVVWRGFWGNERYIFKVKGKKHSTSKVKTLASVDPEVIKNIYEFVEYACTVNRIEQGIVETNSKEKSDMPKLLKWVSNDIISEENEELIANNLEWRNVAKECNNRVREYFFEKIDNL